MRDADLVGVRNLANAAFSSAVGGSPTLARVTRRLKSPRPPRSVPSFVLQYLYSCAPIHALSKAAASRPRARLLPSCAARPRRPLRHLGALIAASGYAQRTGDSGPRDVGSRSVVEAETRAKIDAFITGKGSQCLHGSSNRSTKSNNYTLHLKSCPVLTSRHVLTKYSRVL